MLTARSHSEGFGGWSEWIVLLAARVGRIGRATSKSILAALLLCACGLFAAQAQATPVIDYPNFSSATGLQLNGGASLTGSSLQLTPAQEFTAGTAWSRTEIQPAGSFETEFELRMHESNTLASFGTFADGMAFVLQPDSAEQIGEPGGDLGYAGISPSAVVQFDIYQNTYDPAVPYISFMENGDAETHLATSESPLPFPLYGETPVRAWVVYDAEHSELSVYAAQAPASKPAKALFSFKVNLAELLHSEYAFAGFTAGTGSGDAVQEVLNWQLSSDLPSRTVGAPTVATLPPESVTQTSAGLNATVNPNSVNVSECKFEYATAAFYELTTAYEASVPCSSLPGSGSTPVAVAAAMMGLTANTTYHFRIAATSVGGTSDGSDETFKTLPNAPTVVTNAASAITQTAATLNASVNPNGGEVTKCELEYGETISYGKAVPCSPAPGSGTSPVSVAAAIGSLSANTTYHFRIVATNAGATSEGTDETFKTLPNAPTVVTNAASAITQTAATLNASVNPNGGEVTKCELEYGETISYGKAVPCSPAPGSGTSPVSVAAAIGSLSANTTYHFRIVATNAGATSEGTDETFKTLPNAPTVVTNAASAITQTAATLNASVNPNGGEVTKCELEYGETISYGKAVPCSPAPGSGTSPVSVAAAIGSLSANTTYHFRIVATNAGATSEGTDETFKTLPNAPTVVTNAASAITQTAATLNASVNPNGGEVTKCELEYGETISYGKAVPCSPAPGSGTSPVSVAAAIGSLSANTTYHFRIVATNAGATSEGTDETFKTLPNAPTVVTNAASAITQTAATLNASVNPNGGEVTKCELEYGETISYGKAVPCSPAPGSGTSPVSVAAAIGSLSANTTYHFRIVATNAGATSEGTDETFKTLPNAPTVVTNAASAITQTAATLNASVNPNGGEVTKCELEYGETISYGKAVPCSPAPGSGTSPVSVAAAIGSLSANTTYHFRIVATNAGATSEGTDETFKTLPNAPTVVTNAASAITQTAATLNASVNPNGGEVTKCELEYGETISYGKAVPCSPAPGSGTSPVSVAAAIGSLSANTTYHFRIVATNAGATSEGTDETFKTLPNAPTVVTNAASAITQTAATLNASVNPNGGEVTKCELEYGETISYGKAVPCSPAPGSGTSPVSVAAAIGSLSANTTYHFRIVATNAGATSEGTDETFKTLPNAPTVVTNAASAITQTAATLNASVNPNGGEVTKCELEYGETISYGKAVPCSPAPGSGTSPVSVAAAIGSLSANTTYHFRIVATNAGATSEGTDETFKTLPNAPTVVTNAASAITQTAATLNASVNPNGGEVTKCELEYGETISYGKAVPCSPAPGSGTSPVSVAAAIGSLSANTTYHFRIVATNAGATSEGTDETFKTLPNAPTVVTNAASAITQTAATLNASVNPNGGEVTKCELEYGETISYGKAVPCSPAPGSGTSPVSVAAAIGSLSANTTYHFRIVATNAGATSEGTDETFKTLPNAPTVVTNAASAITQTAATLNASVNPNGGEVTKCELEYGETISYGKAVPCSPAPGSGTSPVSVAAAIGSLSANTTYHFRIVATNAGATSEGTDETFKTLPNAPTVVTNAASAITQTAATLNASVNPNGGEVTKCELEYGETISYGKAVPCSPAPGSGTSPVSVAAAIGSLSANTTYHFRIVATNAGATSEGTDETFKTLPNAPTVVTNAASAITQTAATLNASVNPNGGEVTKCELEYGETISYGKAVPCSPAPGSGTSPVSVAAAIGSLSANTTYHFRIVATNAGATSEGTDETFKTLPNAPTVVTNAASAITQTAATLNASVNPNGGEVTKCELEYGETISYGKAVPCSPAPGSGTSPVSVAAAIGSLSANTTYHFRIVATNAGATSEGTDETFKTLPNAPTVVTNAASAITQTAATLNASVNPNGGEVTKCELEYGETISYGKAVPCSPAPGSGTSPVSVAAAIGSLSANTTYHFRIVATNAGATSEGTDETFKTLPNAPTISSIAPKQGSTAGATQVTIKGTGFGTSTATNTVTFGGASATVSAASATSLTVSTPPGSPGAASVMVTNTTDTLSVTDSAAYTYIAPPTISSIAPKQGSTAGATQVTIKGTGFGTSTATNTVTFGGASATVSAASATSLTVSTPPGSPGAASVVVTNTTDTLSVTDSAAYTYIAPPTVVTGKASAITQTTATLNATVNPNGGEVTKCTLEYGITSGYGSIATCSASPSSGTGAVAVSVSLTGLTANTTYHFRIVTTNAGGTTMGLDETFATPPAPSTGTATGKSAVLGTVEATLPLPKLAVTGNLAPVSGTVLVKLPGSSTFVSLTSLRQIPFGTIIDATHGDVRVTTTGPHGVLQTIVYSEGEFKLTQGRDGLVVATLTGGDFEVCPTARERSHLARAITARASSKHAVRKLWSEGHGHYSTKGSYAAGAVLGTHWLTEDFCDGTLVRVVTDRVLVTNLVNHRHLTVKAGHSYFAKAP